MQGGTYGGKTYMFRPSFVIVDLMKRKCSVRLIYVEPS